MTKKKLSIGLIHSYESLSTLKNCLHALTNEFRLLPEWNFAIYLVQTPLSRLQNEDLKEFLFLHIIKSTTENLAINRNLLLQHCQTELLYFTDPDCELVGKSLKNLLEVDMKNNIFAVAGSNISKSPNLNMQKCFDLLANSLLTHGGLSQIQLAKKQKEVTHSPTCHLLTKKQTLLNWGGFDENFSFVGEDLECNYRLSKKKYKILIIPQASVLHHQSSQWRNWFRKCFNYGQAQTFLLRKYPAWLFNRRFLPLLILFLGLLNFKIFLLLLFTVSTLILFETVRQNSLKSFPRFFAFITCSVFCYLCGELRGLVRLPLTHRQL